MEDKLLDNEISLLLKSTIIVCYKCDSIFNSKKEFRCHFQTCIEDQNKSKRYKSTKRIKTLKCEECFKTFYDKPQLKQHRQTNHLKESKGQCPICFKELLFYSIRKLYKHIVKFHPHESESPKYKEILAEFTNLNEHLKCKDCGKTMTTYLSLKNHIRYIHESKECICPQCGKTFKNEKYLGDHLTRNHGKLTVSCDQCGNLYRTKSILNRHYKVVHLKVRHLECNKCDQRFNNGKALKEHMQAIHEKVKPFSCLLCEYKCVKYGNLNTHRNAVHKLDNLPKPEYDEQRKQLKDGE